MGLHNGAWAKCWSVQPGKGRFTNVQLSINKKQQDGTFVKDFSGYCTFFGKAHAKAAMLKGDERIKLLEVDVGNSYDKEKNKEFVNYRVFDFELPDGSQSSAPAAAASNPVEGNDADDDTPF